MNRIDFSDVGLLLQADALEGLRALPDHCAHVCVTSPPYYGLRDYGVEGQMGLEGSVPAYLAAMVRVFREAARVLRPDGTLWLNMGDSYATDSGPQPPAGTRNKHGHTARHIPQGFKNKDLMGIPWRLALALQEDGWYLRSDIIWHKTNAMPESVHDRPTRAHEYLFLLTRREKYYYNASAIVEPCTAAKGNARSFRGSGAYTTGASFHNSTTKERETHGNSVNESGVRNKRDVWPVAAAHFDGAHFATFPPELIRPCILAGAPPAGVILDPFMGSGTTALTALEEGRRFIGIELNPKYVKLSAARINNALQQGIQTKLEI